MSSITATQGSILVDTDILTDYLRGADTSGLLVRALQTRRCFISVVTIAEIFATAGNEAEYHSARALLTLFQPLGIPMRYADSIAKLLSAPELRGHPDALRIAQNGAISKETKVPVLSILHSSLYSRLDISTIMPDSIR